MHSSHTIFEIGWRSFPWKDTFGPLLFVALGFLLFWLGSSSKAKWLGRRKTVYAVFGAFIGSIALIMFVVLLVRVVPDFVTMRHDYRTGNSVVVEGVVQDFQPAPDIGPANESFTIDDKTFS